MASYLERALKDPNSYSNLVRALDEKMKYPVHKFFSHSKKYTLFKYCHSKTEASKLVTMIRKVPGYAATKVREDVPTESWVVGIRRDM
jgi:hypothetical protein